MRINGGGKVVKDTDLNRLSVALPCAEAWQSMYGDTRVRNCSVCSTNVYNIEGLTAAEVQELLNTHEGRLCIRLIRRADGTVLTKDCPPSVRKYAQRVGRISIAAVTLVMGLFSYGFSQKEKNTYEKDRPILSKPSLNPNEGVLIGTVCDPNGAIIRGARLVLQKVEGKKSRKIATTFSNQEGGFQFGPAMEGQYLVEVTYTGFKKGVFKNVILKGTLLSDLRVVLEPRGESVVVGIFTPDHAIDITASGTTTVISEKKIRSLPH